MDKLLKFKKLNNLGEKKKLQGKRGNSIKKEVREREKSNKTISFFLV